MRKFVLRSHTCRRATADNCFAGMDITQVPCQSLTVRLANTALCAVLMAGCVHTSVERVGRMRLEHGREGMVPLYAALPNGFRVVASIEASASGLADPERLERYIRRRASIMGCDGVTGLQQQDEDRATAQCVKRHDPEPTGHQALWIARHPDRQVLEELAQSGPAGLSLLRLVLQHEHESPRQRGWALRWYLQQYPTTPFRDTIEQLLVDVAEEAFPRANAAVRNAQRW